MPAINGIHCSVHTSDGPLKEYPCVPGLLPNTFSVYILARDGQQFSIKCNVPVLYEHMPEWTGGLTFHLEIDGVMEQPMLLDHEKSSISIQGTSVDTGPEGWQIRKFMFSSVELTEEKGRSELTQDNINKIGEIKVSVCRYMKTGGYGIGPGHGHDEGMKRAVIHEKAVKGRDISHSVQRAKGESCAPVPTIAGTYLDTTAHPYMTFKFFYKSERTLKNMGLIERSPSPPPYLRTERDPSPARSRPVKNENGKVKRERESSAGPSKRKKVARHLVNLDEVETIDLTGDD